MKESEIQVCQLSDDHQDGTAAAQIEEIGRAGFLGWQCVSQNYTEPFPETDASLWYWDGSKVSAKILVPESISAAQGHLALIEFGLYKAAVDFINAIPDPNTKLKSEVNFYRRNDWQRDNQVLLDLAQGLGITSEQLDQMFIFGATQ